MGTCNDLRNALGRNVRLHGEKKIMPVGLGLLDLSLVKGKRTGKPYRWKGIHIIWFWDTQQHRKYQISRDDTKQNFNQRNRLQQDFGIVIHLHHHAAMRVSSWYPFLISSTFIAYIQYIFIFIWCFPLLNRNFTSPTWWCFPDGRAPTRTLCSGNMRTPKAHAKAAKFKARNLERFKWWQLMAAISKSTLVKPTKN